MRTVQFRYQPGANLYIVPIPTSDPTNQLLAFNLTETDPGVYIRSFALDVPHEVFARSGDDPAPATDVAFGSIPCLAQSTPIPGRPWSVVGDEFDGDFVTPPDYTPAGQKQYGLLASYVFEGFGLLDCNTVDGVEDPPGTFNIDRCLQFLVGSIYAPNHARIRLSVSGGGTGGFFISAYNWETAEWVRLRRIIPSGAPTLVHVPLNFKCKDPTGRVSLRIHQVAPDTTSGEAARIVVGTAILISDHEAGTGGEVYPAEEFVALGVQYGPTGLEYTGTAEDLGPVPDKSDVREGVATGGAVGTVHLPPQPKVEEGYGYGADSIEFIGSGCPADGGTTVPPPLDSSGNLTICRGDDYGTDPAELDNAPRWEIPADWLGIDETATVKVAYRGFAGSGEFEAAEIAGTFDHVRLPMGRAETIGLQSAADYRYDVQVTTANGHVRTLAYGSMVVLDTYTDPSG